MKTRTIAATAAAVPILVAAGFLGWRMLGSRPAPVLEQAMTVSTDIPTAVAAAPGGCVWFTIDFSDSIGCVEDAKVRRIPKGGRSVEPIGLAADAFGAAWFTDPSTLSVKRITPAGEVRTFPIGTPIVRLGRLAVAPDGGVWFAESTAYSITRLKDGKFTRHVFESLRGGPYGVAVGADGTVWATLQSGNRLVRITPDGALSEIEIPTFGSSPTDVAVAPDGGVWFVEFRAGKVGRYAQGRFAEFAVPEGLSALSGLAIAPDGAVWFGAMRGASLVRFKDAEFRAFKLPRDGARPYTLSIDAQGNVWYADISGFVGRLPAEYAKR